MNLEERLDNIERQYITALAEKDLKTAALEKELSELKAKQGKNDESDLADELLERITAPSGSAK